MQGVKVAGSSQGPATTVTKGEELLEGTEGRLLNRVLRCTLKGWEVEPDQRHTDLVIQELDSDKANEVITPGEKDPKGKAVEVEEELSPEDTTKYRAIVARANYLAADRPDIMYAVKELCRGMAKPTTVMWHSLKRLGRYLGGSERTALKYEW